MNASPPQLDVHVISTERIHAVNRTRDVHCTPLSILDAHVADFSPVQIISLFDAVPSKGAALTVDNLHKSLQGILGFYPQWCGRLQWNDFDLTSTSHLKRYGRFVLSWGGDQDPGVDFVVARTATELASLVPTAEERAKMQAWDATDFPRGELIPTTVLPPDPKNPYAPPMIVQVTQFRCGGLALVIKMPHSLTDGLGLSRFMQGWAVLARGESTTSVPMPTFDPQRLDHAAAGDIDSDHADPALSHLARGLSCHRYDWWISGKDCPFRTHSTQIPPVFQSQVYDDPGEPIPWSEWDVTAPTKILVLHFSRSELQALQEAAQRIEHRATKQDALVTHLWSCINRARGMGSSDEPVYLNYALGARARTSPPLPDGFVGSPILLASTSATGREASQVDSLALLAARLRQTLARFTPDAMAAYLHDRIYEQSPQRLWQTFLGRRHVLSTSIVHAGFSVLDYGFGTPRYVESVMPTFDGLIVLLEGQSKRKAGRNNDWSAGGVDCHVHLQAATAERLLQDPLLRRFA